MCLIAASAVQLLLLHLDTKLLVVAVLEMVDDEVKQSFPLVGYVHRPVQASFSSCRQTPMMARVKTSK